MHYESEDGVEWRRPELDIRPFGTHERTNVLLDLDTGGTLIYANVFVVPEARELQRYLMYVLRRPDEPEGLEGDGTVAGFGGPDGTEARDRGVYRYRSADGLHWQPEMGPVLVNDPDLLRPDGTADSIFIYRQPDGSYVAYHKTIIRGLPGGVVPYELGAGGCRVIVRRTSEDGVTWSPHELCILPDWRDPPDTQFMELSVTPMEGGYVGVLTVYRAGNQTLEFQLAASRDGRRWWRPDRRACVPQPPLGDYGGGMMWGTHHIVADGDSLHYYYGGMEGIHGDMLGTEEADVAARQGRPYRGLAPLHGEVLARSPSEIFQHGALCRATWRKGRLWAMTTASGGNSEGHAITASVMREGEVLDVNVSTFRGGELLAELVDDSGNVLPGFGWEECDGFSGDALRTTMTWRGNAQCPSDGLRVRFTLRRARLYGFEFNGGGGESSSPSSLRQDQGRP